MKHPGQINYAIPPMTSTSEGWLRAITVSGLHFVPKLDITVSTVSRPRDRSLHPPKRDEMGRIIYALPGGGEYIHKGDKK